MSAGWFWGMPLLVALCACSTSFSARVDETQIAQGRSNNTGIVLAHTSLHDENCQSITAILARPDAAGRYVRTQDATFKGPLDLSKVPSQVVLPAGDYGIVGLRCSAPYRNRNYNARVVQRGSILDGTGAVYERPIATFRVAAGEVVDIGSLRLPSRPIARRSFAGPTAEFIGVVTPIPEPWLQNLAVGNPTLYNTRIVRPMAVPARS